MDGCIEKMGKMIRESSVESVVDSDYALLTVPAWARVLSLPPPVPSHWSSCTG